MGKLALLIWIVAAPTLMGILVVVALGVPYFKNDQDVYMIVAAVAGAVIAMPVSYFVARAISNAIRQPS
ncbi:MAG: hypothetical protein H6855_05270 [Rhodospirillales bacterium]|nr:hypothetical protein [Rhodospirillales bacterium]